MLLDAGLAPDILQSGIDDSCHESDHCILVTKTQCESGDGLDIVSSAADGCLAWDSMAGQPL